MSPVNHDALSAHIDALFDDLSLGVHTKYDITTVSESIQTSVLRALRRRLSIWNENNAKCSLPPEVLAMAFGHLSFSNKFAASHVCRSWRSGATQYPSVWASIDLAPARGASPLLKLALSWTGNLPLYFRLKCLTGDVFSASDVGATVGEHLHRFRSITWDDYSTPDVETVWEHPAPFLERLTCAASFRLAENFLAGQLGRLTHLELQRLYLPRVAPALATVTVLSAFAPRGSDILRVRLFDLFPRLESLTLDDLPNDTRPLFSRDQAAPSSLRKLWLHAADDARDAIELAAAWRTDRLSQVTITSATLNTTIHPTILAPFLSGARHLGLHKTPAWSPSLVVEDALRNERTLVYEPEEHSALLQGLLNVAPALEHLESLDMSLTDFNDLMERPQHPTLPALRTLALFIHVAAHRAHDWFIPRGNLTALHSHKFTQLDRLILEVACGDCVDRFPANSDAVELLEHLASSAQHIAPRASVCIRGFPAAAICDLVGVDAVPGLQIKFEAL